MAWRLAGLLWTDDGPPNGTTVTLRRRVRGAVGRALRHSPPGLQHALRRGSMTLLRALGPADVTGHPPLPGAVWQSPPVPVPEGTSLPELEKSFRSWSVNSEPVGHLDGYVDDSIWRFVHTWGMVRDRAGRCLELGANPYFTTYLLDRYTGLDLTLANYYGRRGDTTDTVSFVPPGETDRVKVARTSQMFNIEEDDFPFEAGSFDVVLFCEIVEHLLMDPLAVLRQVHRVLKPGGALVLTTPNVSRLDNVFEMINGDNIYDPYSGFGPYGRHNREYNRYELRRLLEFAGFEVEDSFSADGHAADPRRYPSYEDVAPLVRFRSQDLGHYLFVRARPVRQPRQHFPSFLYRSDPAGNIVPFS